jgi:hypothetical protein
MHVCHHIGARYVRIFVFLQHKLLKRSMLLLNN